MIFNLQQAIYLNFAILKQSFISLQNNKKKNPECLREIITNVILLYLLFLSFCDGRDPLIQASKT
jgi:hypothetical protein